MDVSFINKQTLSKKIHRIAAIRSDLPFSSANAAYLTPHEVIDFKILLLFVTGHWIAQLVGSTSKDGEDQISISSSMSKTPEDAYFDLLHKSASALGSEWEA